MFDALTNRFTTVFRNLSGRGRISEENVREAMAGVREALLEADVHFSVVKQFCDHALAKAQGQEVIKSLEPGQLMAKICYDELINLLGPVDTRIYYVQPGPTIIMMCGLQGSGKTTTCGKLAKYLVAQGRHPLLAAADLQRPAAVDQLATLGEQTGVPVYRDDSRVASHGTVAKGSAVAVCRAAVQQAKATGCDVVILDTAGRLHIDNELMGELRDINAQLGPHQIYLVLDSMSGQDAVNSAKAFNEQLELDGLILTKLDSDTRGGALLSAKMITGKPIKFLGSGEKLDALEEFRPEGMAERILGMGDIVGLVTEMQKKFDIEEAAKLQAKMAKGQFTLDDFIAQMEQVRKLGPIGKVMGMIPGMSQLSQQMGMNDGDVEGQMKHMRAMYDSMTREERKNPDLLDGGRRRRVSRGSGLELNEVSQFLKQYDMAKNMMKAVGGMGLGGKMQLMKSLMSGNLNNLGMPGGPMLRTKKSGYMEKKDRNKKKRR
ncbi:MAG: signal recognition particle protein [Tepidisphaeraceae bacterium]|jgi:signal recognition particle subunit SRP54